MPGVSSAYGHDRTLLPPAVRSQAWERLVSWEIVEPGTGSPVFDNAPELFTPGLYANIGRVLAEGEATGPQPTIGARTDGKFLFYPGAVNALVGAPETGKTLLALCVLSDELFRGNSVLVIDLDHNGAAATAQRLRSFGVSEAVLSDTDRFRYCSPEDSEELLLVVAETQHWKPAAVLVDSVGEVVPLFGANSNDSDQYTAVHRQVFTALANSGAAVLVIDHEPKSEASAGYGATGTAAKKRAIDGALYRVTLRQTFVKGKGGKAALSVLKDRHSAIRQISAQSGREPLAAVFELKAGSATDWKFHPPEEGESFLFEKAARDVALLKELSPVPSTIRKAQDLLKEQKGIRWGKDRASRAIALLKEETAQGSVPVPPLKGEGTRTTLPLVLEGQGRTEEGQGQQGREQ